MNDLQQFTNNQPPDPAAAQAANSPQLPPLDLSDPAVTNAAQAYPVVPPLQMQDLPINNFGQQQNRGTTISVSPESAPITIGSTERMAPVEQGFDTLKQPEQKAETVALPESSPETGREQGDLHKEDLNAIENKEFKAPGQQTAPLAAAATEEKKEPEAPVTFPKYSGYEIAEEFKDPAKIEQNKGRGDKNLANTAIWFFLDRLLKKEAQVDK